MIMMGGPVRKRKAVALEVQDKLLVRPLEQADIPSIIAIDARIAGAPKPEYWRHKLAQYVTQHDAPGEPGNGVLARAAVIDDKLVAFMIGGVRRWEFGQPASGWITSLAVDPDWQKMGIGRRLLAELLAYYREQELPEVRTIVDWVDADLLRFFHSMGFVRGPYVELQKLL